MNRLRWIGLAAAGLFICGCLGFHDYGPHVINLDENYLSPEGWQGRQILRDGVPTQEELDSRGSDGRIDLWRYYQDGKKTREMYDLNDDDLIDVACYFDTSNGSMILFERYLDSDRKPDLTIKHLFMNRWRQEWDRNGDGKVDFDFSFRGPSTVLTDFDVDPTTLMDIRDLLPKGLWRLLKLDEDHDGVFETELPYPNA
ncbi:MAG: hypothetical protein JXA52_07290 [Planctomycetes bacterium]|nr:hypothetical protein [Planctomycetota bacterium]